MMRRSVRFITELTEERNQKRKIRRKTLHLYLRNSYFYIAVYTHKWSRNLNNYTTDPFIKYWDFSLTHLVSHKNGRLKNYYPKNIDPIAMSTLLCMADSCEQKVAESTIYHAFYQLEIVPAFINTDKFKEGWLKEHLPTYWEYWAGITLSEREAEAEAVINE